MNHKKNLIVTAATLVLTGCGTKPTTETAKAEWLEAVGEESYSTL